MNPDVVFVVSSAHHQFLTQPAHGQLQVIFSYLSDLLNVEDKAAEKTNSASLVESALSLDGRTLMLKTSPVTPTLVSVSASLTQWTPMTM